MKLRGNMTLSFNIFIALQTHQYIYGTAEATITMIATQTYSCLFQETFRNCADIQIFSNAPTGWVPNEVDAPSAIYVMKRTRNGQVRKFPFIVRHQVCVPTQAYKDQPDMGEWCQTNCLRYPPNCPPEKCTCP